MLSRANKDLLEMFAWSNVLLAFDYDGTLAPLVRTPDRAAMRPATRKLLACAAKAYPCVVISGRAQADALRRLQGIEVCRVVGNHGSEPWPGSARLRRQVRRWMPALEENLSRRQGVVIEDKDYSVAIHYRQARKRSATRRAILGTARDLAGVRIIGGKLAVNLVPEGAPHKGLALERERARFRCDTVVYVGDDDTDEDVFRLDWPGRLLSIRVGSKRASAASYFLKNQLEIDRLLTSLVAMRGRLHG